MERPEHRLLLAQEGVIDENGFKHRPELGSNGRIWILEPTGQGQGNQVDDKRALMRGVGLEEVLLAVGRKDSCGFSR